VKRDFSPFHCKKYEKNSRSSLSVWTIIYSRSNKFMLLFGLCHTCLLFWNEIPYNYEVISTIGFSSLVSQFAVKQWLQCKNCQTRTRRRHLQIYNGDYFSILLVYGITLSSFKIQVIQPTTFNNNNNNNNNLEYITRCCMYVCWRFDVWLVILFWYLLCDVSYSYYCFGIYYIIFC